MAPSCPDPFHFASPYGCFCRKLDGVERLSECSPGPADLWRLFPTLSVGKRFPETLDRPGTRAISCPLAARLCSSSLDPFPLTAFIPMCVLVDKSVSLGPSSWVVKCHAGRPSSPLPSTRKLGLLKPQESLSVEMTDLLFIRRADGCVIQKGSPLLIGTERVIDREDDAVGPYDLQGEQERWIGEETAGRHMEVV